MVYTLRFFSSSKCSLFHNSNFFGSGIIQILYTGCAKIKKKIIPAPKVIDSLTKGKISMCFHTLAGVKCTVVSDILQRMWRDVNGNFYLCIAQIEAGKKYETSGHCRKIFAILRR